MSIVHLRMPNMVNFGPMPMTSNYHHRFRKQSACVVKSDDFVAFVLNHLRYHCHRKFHRLLLALNRYFWLVFYSLSEIPGVRHLDPNPWISAVYASICQGHIDHSANRKNKYANFITCSDNPPNAFVRERSIN